MKRSVIAFIASTAFSASITFAQDPAVKTPPAAGAKGQTSAQSFLSEAAQDGMAEVELGRLAASNASSAEVKAFGQQMVTDHGKANDEVKALAAKKSITLPKEVGAKHKAEHDKLAQLSGEAFDRAYVQAMVADHEKAVSTFKEQSTMNPDAEVKAWAAKTLPTLEEHLTKVRNLAGTVGGAAK
jgi:putative membrane protein